MNSDKEKKSLQLVGDILNLLDGKIVPLTMSAIEAAVIVSCHRIANAMKLPVEEVVNKFIESLKKHSTELGKELTLYFEDPKN